MTRLYGWAPHDQRATGSVPRNHGKNTTLVAALTPEGLQAPWTIEGAMDTAAFERYVSEVLGPTLRPGQVVVLDNLSVHKADSIRLALEARHCQLLFLPPLYPKVLTERPSGMRVAEACATAWGTGERLCRPCGATASSRWSFPSCQRLGCNRP